MHAGPRPVDGCPVYLLACGEKAFAQFRIRTRGRGLLIGAEVARDAEFHAADAKTAQAVQLALLGRGFVVGMCGREHNVLKINPPLCVSADDADQLLQATEESLAVVLASA